MNVIDTALREVKIIEPTIFHDNRGCFFEAVNEKKLSGLLKRDVHFVQTNTSCSTYGVLRGLHSQRFPYAQAKLIYCVSGVIYDVAVDVRDESPLFGQWTGVELSEQNRRQIWIPEGFAHGFVCLSEKATVLYQTTAYYCPDAELRFAWNDHRFNIDWPVEQQNLVLSEADALVCQSMSGHCDQPI